MLGPPGVGLERLLQHIGEFRELAGLLASPCSHFEIVLRDSPVMRDISRPDFFFRLCKRRILPGGCMVITPRPLLNREGRNALTGSKMPNERSILNSLSGTIFANSSIFRGRLIACQCVVVSMCIV